MTEIDRLASLEKAVADLEEARMAHGIALHLLMLSLERYGDFPHGAFAAVLSTFAESLPETLGAKLDEADFLKVQRAAARAVEVFGSSSPSSFSVIDGGRKDDDQ